MNVQVISRLLVDTYFSDTESEAYWGCPQEAIKASSERYAGFVCKLPDSRIKRFLMALVGFRGSGGSDQECFKIEMPNVEWYSLDLIVQAWRDQLADKFYRALLSGPVRTMKAHNASVQHTEATKLMNQMLNQMHPPAASGSQQPTTSSNPHWVPEAPHALYPMVPATQEASLSAGQSFAMGEAITQLANHIKAGFATIDLNMKAMSDSIKSLAGAYTEIKSEVSSHTIASGDEIATLKDMVTELKGHITQSINQVLGSLGRPSAGQQPAWAGQTAQPRQGPPMTSIQERQPQSLQRGTPGAQAMSPEIAAMTAAVNTAVSMSAAGGN